MIRLDFGKPTQEKEQAFAHIPRTPPTLTELLCQIIMKLSDLGRAIARFLGDRKREDTMPNIQDYVLWRGDLPLERVPLCDVDALLLSYLSYMPYDHIAGDAFDEGISLRDAAQKLLEVNERDKTPLAYNVREDRKLLAALMESARFRDIRLVGYVNKVDPEQEEQFAAVTYLLGEGRAFVAFRGTDDTFAGWREDFAMTYTVVGAQTRALEYLGRMTRQYPDARLRIGGHSKGGNLSVYAAVKAPAAVQDRIVQVYNNDGPGFAKPLVGTPEHTRVADRILTVVPQSSVVGQLLEHEQNVEIVRSDAEGMLQHDGFSWQVVGDHFIHLDGFSREGKVIDETLESWEGSLSPKQREAFADALYTVLTASGAKTLSDLNGDKLKSAVTMLKTYSNLDRETRQLLSGSLRALVGSYAKNVADDVQKNDLEPLRRKLERQRKKAEKRGAKKK